MPSCHWHVVCEMMITAVWIVDVIYISIEWNGWIKPVGIGTVVTVTAFLGGMGYFIFSGFDQNRTYENSGDKDDIDLYLGKRDSAIWNAVIPGIMGGILFRRVRGSLSGKQN